MANNSSPKKIKATPARKARKVCLNFCTTPNNHVSIRPPHHGIKQESPLYESPRILIREFFSLSERKISYCAIRVQSKFFNITVINRGKMGVDLSHSKTRMTKPFTDLIDGDVLLN